MAILPYLGFPYSWKDVLTTLAGLGLIVASYLLYKDSKMIKENKKETFENFSENKFVQEETDKKEEVATEQSV